MALSADELYEGLRANPDLGRRVHWARGLRFAGTPGHLYLYREPRTITALQLARLSRTCGNVEVCLETMDDTTLVYVGPRRVAVSTLWMPPRDIGIDRFEWIAHTHPLEMESAEEGVARGPTSADREALQRVHERWGQTRSRVIVCRGGTVVRDVPFEIERAAGGMPSLETLRSLRTPIE